MPESTMPQPAFENGKKNAENSLFQFAPFKREKDDKLDKEYDYLLGKLRLHLEHYSSKRNEEHPWLGAMLGLHKGCEANMIKLHSLIGRYKQLPEDDPKRLRFNRRLKWGQIFACRHMRRVLVWPHDELRRILEEATGESKKFYPYRYVDDLEIPIIHNVIPKGPCDPPTVPPTDWPFPEEKTGLVAPPIPSNNQLRAHRTQAAFYNSWVGNHPDELEANNKCPSKSSLGQKIRAFLAKLKEKRSQSKAIKEAKRDGKKPEPAKVDNTGDAADSTSAIGLSIPAITVGDTEDNRAETPSIVDDINAIGADGVRINGLTQHPVRQPVDE